MPRRASSRKACSARAGPKCTSVFSRRVLNPNRPRSFLPPTSHKFSSSRTSRSKIFRQQHKLLPIHNPQLTTTTMQALRAGQVVELSDGRSAAVRFVGVTAFAAGEWIGVEFTEPLGKNDGSVQGQRYFSCQPNHGMFLRRSAVARVVEPNVSHLCLLRTICTKRLTFSRLQLHDRWRPGKAALVTALRSHQPVSRSSHVRRSQLQPPLPLPPPPATNSKNYKQRCV